MSITPWDHLGLESQKLLAGRILPTDAKNKPIVVGFYAIGENLAIEQLDSIKQVMVGIMIADNSGINVYGEKAFSTSANNLLDGAQKYFRVIQHSWRKRPDLHQAFTEENIFDIPIEKDVQRTIINDVIFWY